MTVFSLCKCSRRAFALHGLGLGLAAGLASNEGLAKALAGYQPKTFTQHELATVKALMSRFIPADGKNGGAVEACAYIYLDQALGAHHARYVGTYRSGLQELDRWAQQERARFATLAPAKMDELIARMEKGELLGGKFPDGGTAFFSLIRKHTLEGFLSDPMYGGNKDFIGWQAIGYNGVQLIYPDATQQLNGHDDREQRSIAAFGGSPLP